MFIDEKKRPRLALLWDLSYGSRALYLTAVVFMLISVICGFLLPQVVRFAVDNVVGGMPVSDLPFAAWVLSWLGIGSSTESLRQNIHQAGVIVLIISAFGGVCSYVYRKALALSAEGLVKRLRCRLYSHIQSLPYEWHIGIQTGDIIQRCTSDVEVVRNFIFTQLIEIVRAIVLVAFAYGILFQMNAALSLASFAFLTVIFLYSFVFLRMTAERFLVVDEAEGELLSIAQENFTGVRVVRAFGRERYEADRFARQNELYANLWVRLGNLLSTFWGFGDFITGMQMIMICAVGALQAASGGMTVGEFIVFLTYNSMIIWPVRGLGRVLSEASKTSVSVGRIREILDALPEADPPDALESPIDGDIEFDRVSFSYGDAPVLKDISFTVKRGTTLGIIGATGAGKTTLAHLMCRLYDLKDGCGEIRIGGVNINRYRRAWLRKNVGIVLQEPHLYSRTIGENVASLSGDISIEQIREASAISQIDDAVMQFAKGYDTLVGERGVTLSGGQKQRVAIARTILKAPPIMIFDDSLSAVDTETESRIRSAMARLAGGATVIVISHRITSLSGADVIMVMENGAIAEMGSQGELMAKNGIYRRIRDLQQSVEDEIEEAGGKYALR
ncbi:MAG: ABC transporter ATP-binding protein/permease [Synergistaceae bacterium]|jgi:ATP-binding cassette subfamily B protein|nr:ABC transporter ATP-binding protein/permease [Synergistaceae bacterium]